MKQIAVIALAVLLIGSSGAKAGYVETTQELHENCQLAERILADPRARTTDPQKMKAGICLGYIEGIINGIIVADRVGGLIAKTANRPRPRRFFCEPKLVSSIQLISIFQKWAKRNPDKWHEPAGANVVIAFQKAWPCKRTKEAKR